MWPRLDSNSVYNEDSLEFLIFLPPSPKVMAPSQSKIKGKILQVRYSQTCLKHLYLRRLDINCQANNDERGQEHTPVSPLGVEGWVLQVCPQGWANHILHFKSHQHHSSAQSLTHRLSIHSSFIYPPFNSYLLLLPASSPFHPPTGNCDS